MAAHFVPFVNQIRWQLLLRLLWYSLLLVILGNQTIQTHALDQPLGIPGTAQTINGYDTSLGTDAICWGSHAGTNNQSDIPFPNPLVPDYQIQGAVELFPACPNHNTLQATEPIQFQLGERPRTGLWYNYTINVTLDLTTFHGSEFVSNVTNTTDGGRVVFRGTDLQHMVAFQVILCVLGKSGFCSPFVHEQANARMAAENITTPTPLGYLHGGTHVHSPYVVVPLEPQDGPVYALTVIVPMLVYVPGDYTAIGCLQMMVVNKTDHLNVSDHTHGVVRPDMRYDMANALIGSERLITYQLPAVILEVPFGVLVASYVAIGIVSSILLALLMETIRYRHHQILQLTQGSFLIVFLCACLVATTFSFFLQPKNDLYCRVSFPILFISLQLAFAITLGRLWRINAVINPVVRQALGEEDTWSIKIFHAMGKAVGAFCSYFQRTKNRSFRKQITSGQLSSVVALFTVPQVIIQILILTLQPRKLMVDFNADESIGRAQCSSGVSAKADLLFYGCYLFFILILFLLGMAFATRSLPSLFNETGVIFDVALSSTIMLLLGIAIIILTMSPTVSPAVEYLVIIFVILSMTLQASLRIMMPKLKMVWKNETVVVSRLLSDHARSRRQSTMESSSSRIIVTGLARPEIPSSSDTQSALAESATKLMSSTSPCNSLSETPGRRNGKIHISPTQNESLMVEELEPLSDDANLVEEDNAADTENIEEGTRQGVDGRRITKMDSEASVKQTRFSGEENAPTEQEASRQSGRKKIVIGATDAPSKKFLLKLLDLQHRLTRVNERIMSGLTVSEAQWESLRNMAGVVGKTFENDVQFAWETSQSSQEVVEAINTEQNEPGPAPLAEKEPSDRSLPLTSLERGITT